MKQNHPYETIIRCDNRVGFRYQPTKYLHITVSLGTTYNMWGGNVFCGATLSIQDLRKILVRIKQVIMKWIYMYNCEIYLPTQ